MASTRMTYRGHLRNGTPVIGDVPSGTTAAWFAQRAHQKGWRDLTLTQAGQEVGGIGPHPDTGKRDWWGECATPPLGDTCTQCQSPNVRPYGPCSRPACVRA
jgi:hypothetical protein